VPERIPLFPLGAVLYPGALLPLHIFEQRYRVLLARLSDEPQPARRTFGVVAIRLGRESGVDGVSSLHEVGCLAQVSAVEPYPDGRFDVLARGTRRFRLVSVDNDDPYLSGHVDWLAEPTGAAGHVLAGGVRRRFEQYSANLARLGLRVPEVGGPAGPVALSYTVAGAAILDLKDQQALLAAPDAATRLTMEIDLLRREAALLSGLPSIPGVDYARQPAVPN
jgi:uncharacterized protein